MKNRPKKTTTHPSSEGPKRKFGRAVRRVASPKRAPKLLISYCGIVCSLCPLYRGKYRKKKCSGCWTLNECKIVKCAKGKKIKYCFYCHEFPCKFYRKGFSWDIEGKPVIWKPYSRGYVKLFEIAKKK